MPYRNRRIGGGESMARKGMDVKEFNAVMKRCSEIIPVRYVTPTIHPKFKQVVAFTVHTSGESKEFTVTNNPDENFDLNKAVNEMSVHSRLQDINYLVLF